MIGTVRWVNWLNLLRPTSLLCKHDSALLTYRKGFEWFYNPKPRHPEESCSQEQLMSKDRQALSLGSLMLFSFLNPFISIASHVIGSS